MKKISILSAVVLLLAVAVSCGPTNTQTIGKNVDPDVTKLNNVETYAWIGDADKIPESQVFVSPTGVFVFNNESDRKTIKDAIEYELGARGYEQNSTGLAGMLVSFYVTERADTLRSTNGYVSIYGEPVITEDDVEMTPVQPGTLIINIVENESNEMVWQGFASGILKPEYVNDENKIKEAVSSIFERFAYDAKDS